MDMTKILIIEDAVDLAALVRRELEAEGYTVRHAADGQAGLELFAAFAPDLVLLDWMLPKLDGLTVLRRIRQAPGSRGNVPVLMLTARGEETDRVIGLEVGADDYLTKPFGMREISGSRPRTASPRGERTGSGRSGPGQRKRRGGQAVGCARWRGDFASGPRRLRGDA